MDIGQFRHNIKFKLSVSEKDEFGGEAATSYVDTYTLKGSVKNISGGKSIENEEVVNNKTIEIITHKRPILKNMVIEYNNKLWGIDSINNANYGIGQKIKAYYIENLAPVVPIIPTIPRAGLIGEFLFMGNGNNMISNAIPNYIVYGDVTYTTSRTGILNKAANFTTQHTYMQQPAIYSLPVDYSISFWAKSLYWYFTPYFFGGDTINTYRLDRESRITYSGSYLITPYWGSGWNHFIINRIGLQHIVYRNKNFIGTINTTNANPLQLFKMTGRTGYSSDVYYSLIGQMDDLRIYNRTLNSDEISLLFHEHDYGITP
jgi:hypothetical protein